MKELSMKIDAMIRVIFLVAIVILSMTAFPGQSTATQVPLSPSLRIDYILESISNLLLPILAIAVSTSAIIEALKDLLQPRKYFHLWKIRRWLQGFGVQKWQISRADADACLRTLIDYGATGNRQQFVGAKTEDLVATISSVLQLAMENLQIDRLRLLISVLAVPSEQSDLDVLVQFARKQASAELANNGASSPEHLMAVEEIRKRIWMLLQLRLEALQVHLQHAWSSWLKLASFFISALLIILAYKGIYQGSQLLVIAIIGAVIAPAVRDLIVALKNARESLK